MDIQALAQKFEDSLAKLTGDNTKLSNAQQAVQLAQTAIATDTPTLATDKDALIQGINEAFAAATTTTASVPPVPVTGEPSIVSRGGELV